MQKELEEEKAKCAEAEKLKNKAIRNLANTSLNADPFSQDDFFFKRNFREFRYNVQLWVRNQTWKIVPSGSIPLHYNIFATTTPYYPGYICSEGGMWHLLEARVWQYLTKNVFGQEVWSEGGLDDKQTARNARAYEILKEHLGKQLLSFLPKVDRVTSIDKSVSNEHVKLRHDWRVATARILDAREASFTISASQKAIRGFVIELEEDLNPFAVKSLNKSRLPPKGEKVSLEDIFQEAIRLDCTMQQQRPCFSFYPSWEHIPKFLRNAMEVSNDDSIDILPEDGQQVQLLRAPGLCKHGNSAGRSYEKGQMILKAEVDVVRTN